MKIMYEEFYEEYGAYVAYLEGDGNRDGTYFYNTFSGVMPQEKLFIFSVDFRLCTI